ncbi:FAD-binding domain-containing protein [Gigaspora margarita]|uniref:FAD-binding domain-containing protein n=1 Tax=Gigaspora margarita TaxID=4874 RepID=A0A8H4AVN0_GIGMA|nr:FAD-binding domain-containing protein [Gigaspora margarita]
MTIFFDYDYLCFFIRFPVSKCPEEEALQKCFDQNYIKGPVYFRDNYSSYSKDLDVEYNRRIIYFPTAFVHPIDVIDVQKAIKCAAKLKYPIVARSGGHSYEGFGIGDKDCYLVVELANLNKIIIDVNSQTAVVGPGNRLEPIYNKTSEHMFAFPAGTCPWVGVGGLITGGVSITRNLLYMIVLAKYTLVIWQLFLANGTVVHSAKKHPEIFWAIRGAGNAGYGIVTAFTLKIHPIQKITTVIYLLYDFDQAPLLLSVMIKLGSNIHPNITSLIRIAPEYLKFVKLSKPKNITYTENILYHALVDGMEGTEVKGYYKTKSFFIDFKGLSDEGIKSLMNFLKRFKCEINSNSAVNSENSEMCLQEFDDFSQEFRRNYACYESYQNLNDRQLDDWQCRYYAENFERLVKLKQKYDPYNLFHWNQSIPTHTKISCN